jgi:omega-amidase
MENQDLNITIVQTSLEWENKTKNLLHIEELLAAKKPQTDLIILPEMFSTGFSMNAPKLAETSSGKTLMWMRKMAETYNCVVTGSFITEEDGKYYNRLYWVPENGDVSTYDKRHLFSFANEEAHYSAGNKRIIVELKGWRICPLICYDLRFPVWSRNADDSGFSKPHVYDLLIYVANWPEAREKPWSNLLEARAHENQVYVAGVNRVGKDGNGIKHSGASAIYNPKGEKLSRTLNHQETVETTSLSVDELDAFRKKFTVWKDKDSFSIDC